MTDANRRLLRTIVQTVIGLAAAAPLIIDAAGIPRTAAGAGTALAVAAAITRVMSLDAVQKLLPSWLRANPPQAKTPPTPLPTAQPAANDGGTV